MTTNHSEVVALAQSEIAKAHAIYQEVMVRNTKLAVLALAHAVRDVAPDATTIEFEASDQGDYLVLDRVLAPNRELSWADFPEYEDDLWAWSADLGQDNYGTREWKAFCEHGKAAGDWSMDIEQVLSVLSIDELIAQAGQ